MHEALAVAAGLAIKQENEGMLHDVGVVDQQP